MFFQDYDTLRKGYISKAKFRSALDNLKLNLKEAELVLLEYTFHHAAGQDLVDYIAFNELCEAVFTTKGLE